MDPNIKNRIRAQRPLHKKIVLHPASILVLLAVGVCLAVTTFAGKADTLFVTAAVHAPPLTEPSVITTPPDGYHSHVPEITVSGTCPNDSYVKLFRDGVFLGVAQCVNNRFTITMTLAPGPNKLQAKDYNITDDEGPESPSITVYYDVPTPPTTAPTTGRASPPNNGGLASGVGGLIIYGDYHFLTHFQGENWTWQLSVAGGIPPYKLTIEWGDTTTTMLTLKDGSPFNANHIFKTPGIYHPIVRARDTQGARASLQLAAIVKSKPLFVAVQFNFLDELQKYLWAAWPAYLIIVLMALSFWLGEREAQRRAAEQHSSRS